MKNKLLAILVGSILLTNTLYSATMEFIIPIDSNTLQIVASPDVIFPDGEMNGDIRVVKDVIIIDSVRDIENDRKITLRVLDPILPETNYSIISVGLAEGSIELHTPESIIGEYTNANVLNESNIIERANVIDSNTIELYYNYPIEEGLYDFKLLRELESAGMMGDGKNTMTLSLNSPMEELSSYMLMISYLEDAYGMDIVLDNMLYDFVTGDILPIKSQDEEIDTPDLNAADVLEPTDTNDEIVNTDENLEEVAMSTSTQPDTGPTVWLVIILAFLLSTGAILMRGKKSV